MKHLLSILFVAAIFVSCKTTGNYTELTDTGRDSIIMNQTFKFVPTSATPTGYRSINLSHTYFLKISKDTIEAYLPYFGRAYSATMNPDDAGIKFLSTDFNYQVTPKKKGMYEILIEPKERRDRTRLILSAGNSGYGSLMVTDNNRQAISFSGRIEALD